MIFNEALEQRQQYEEGLLKKWDKALNADGGIKNEHMAKTTAILLENYMGHLQSNPSLIAEERISTNNFKGVNLALLGLIRRAIPTLVGAELVGVQAMPTPQSPIFYMAYKRNQAKGNSAAGSELFGYPGSLALGDDRPTYAPGETGETKDTDPFYSSDNIKYKLLTESSGDFVGTLHTFAGNAVSGTARVVAVSKATKGIVGAVRFLGQATTTAATTNVAGFANDTHNLTVSASGDGYNYAFTIVPANTTDFDYYAGLEYKQESNTIIPELEMQILQYIVTLTRRQLRGKFSLDAAVDAKAYHGISLENELMEMMKLQLTNEINREIVSDLRFMSNKIYKQVDYESYTDNNVTGNYDDTHRLVLDAINGLCAEIYNQTRVGRGNFVVGNPVTLSFLDRVPGFVGSGVDMTSGGLSYAGKQGGRISFYFDPQYPKGELLIGYKGASALDCGYIHAPYLPITATPTLYNQETGDPSKIFYTRYGKTYRDFDGDTGKPFNAIYRGEYFYAKLFLDNFPTLTNIA